MSDKKGGVIINNELTDPLGDFVIDYLLDQTKETTYHDFKAILDISKNSNDFPKIIKDVYAFSNAGGGFLVLGVHENDHSDENIKGTFAKIGLPDDFHIEPASLQEKINSYLGDTPLDIGYTEFNREFYKKQRKFALVYIPPSPKILIPKEDGTYQEGNKQKKAFLKDIIYVRRSTQSIQASEYEIDQIKERVKNEKYRLSIISGEPDKVKEILYSNLFEIKMLPKTVYVGTAKFSSFSETIKALKEKHPEMYFFNLKYRSYEDKIITFQNLANPTNIHCELIDQETVRKESIDSWLDGGDKERIITYLLNREIADKGIHQGMRYDDKSGRLYYPVSGELRSELWPTRYKGVQAKQVGKLMWAEQLQRKVYAHAAVKPAITKIHGQFYLRLNPTMIITDDGKYPSKDPRVGTVITRSSYNKYNNSYLNNVLFWINKLGDGNDVHVIRDFIISNEPIQTTIDTGISWDIPTSDLKKFIEEYDTALDTDDNDDEEDEDEDMLEDTDQYDL